MRKEGRGRCKNGAASIDVIRTEFIDVCVKGVKGVMTSAVSGDISGDGNEGW